MNITGEGLAMLHKISQAGRLHFSLAKLIDSFLNIGEEERDEKRVYLGNHSCTFGYQFFILLTLRKDDLK